MEQNNFPRVKVVNPNQTWLGTEYYINNQKITRVQSVDFHVAVNEIPTFDFEMDGITDIDMFGDVRFSFTPKTVEEAVKVLQNELMKHGDFYNGFLESIERSVKEQQPSLPYRNSKCISEEILKRIIGEE